MPFIFSELIIKNLSAYYTHRGRGSIDIEGEINININTDI